MNTDEAQRSKQVDDWIKKNASDLSPEELVLFYGEAVEAVRRRASSTLSEVTLTAIFDRVLSFCQKDFSFLSYVRIESPGISMKELVAHSKNLKEDEITAGFRYFLMELLSLFGKLTADILTKHLFRELLKVTPDRSAQGASRLRSIKAGSDRGEA